VSAAERFAVGGARGWSWGELDPNVRARLEAWLERGPDQDCETLKPGRVWRFRDVAVKRFPSEGLVRWGLRRSRARRTAELSLALEGVRTPRPIAALEARNGASLYVSEFVDGELLHRIWNAGGPGVEAFPRFLALLHARRVFHGDFHLQNAIWDGRDWVLIDLEGLRHPLRSLPHVKRMLDDWARVHFSLRGARGLRPAFERYLGALREDRAIWGDADRAWTSIVERSRRLAVERGEDSSYVARDGQDPSPWASS
jgi:hypothetical protein